MVRVGCEDCWPELRSISERQGEAHFGVQFGDFDAIVSCNGTSVVNACEVMAGPGGWAVLVVGRKVSPGPPWVVLGPGVPYNWMLEPYFCPCGSFLPTKTRHESDGYSVSISRKVSVA